MLVRHARDLFLLLLALMCGAVANADIPAFNNYPDARVVFSSNEQTGNYVLALGNYTKVGGLWRVSEQRLGGQLMRKTYELPDNHSAEDGFDFFYRQLAGASPRELYRCSGRQCGQSNTWANNHFGIYQLYGLDQFQHFGTFELTAPRYAGVYVTLYSVLRGNRRVFVQLEVLESGDKASYTVASNPETLLNQLLNEGYTRFLKLDYGNDSAAATLADNHLDALVAALNKATALQVAVVGHNHEAVSLSEQQKRSLQVADTLRTTLIKRGIKTERLQAEGLGGLAPGGRGDSRVWVDVVVVQP
ncbi:MAG TPA: DUF4892 domain-containing protein [Cellvibrionaceae bacterium]